MSNFNRVSNVGAEAHFSKAAVGELDRSRLVASPLHLTTFDAGDIVPIYCAEILPDDVYHSLDVDFVIRQSTLLTPTMGNMEVDLYAFFVPNRIVNQSWKAVMGENYNGSWTANPVTLAPLVSSSSGATQVPVGSVADYYGFPTQASIPNSVLSLCNDLKFRGYVMIYNERFRDQNYQPPIPMSTLNVYQGFFGASNSVVPLSGVASADITANTPPDGSFGSGAVAHSLFGSGHSVGSASILPASDSQTVNAPGLRFRALASPLKANKLHDYFTSVLPSPQKSATVFTPVTGNLNIAPLSVVTTNANISNSTLPPLRFGVVGGSVDSSSRGLVRAANGDVTSNNSPGTVSAFTYYPSNLVTVEGSVQATGLNLSVNDLRYAAAVQQVYETLALGGSRYREYIHSFFGLEVDDPFSDVPQYLGHIRRSLDLFQTAQTSASETGNTPQGNLAAFGYTSSSGKLLSSPHRFVEHGYLHVLAVVRHKNIYPTFMARDNFRLSMLDFYQPQLANISEQPVYIREICPISASPNNAFGYQEAWAEYRYEPDYVTGYMRPGVGSSLALWNYADDYNPNQSSADGTWLVSNSQQVLDRTLAVTSSVAPQFKAQFKFFVDKERPMPTYSVPGMDII